MVFGKNIMFANLLKISLFLSIFIINSCSYKEDAKLSLNTVNLNKIKKLNLNVSSYRIENITNITSDKETEIYDFEKSLENSLVDWANKKFILSGTEKDAILYINKSNIILKDIEKNQGIKKIIFFEEKKKYQVIVELLLSFIDEDDKKSNLNIKAEIDLSIKDNTSINDRKRLLDKTIGKLIIGIDKSLNDNLKKKSFQQYYINTNLTDE